MIGGATRGTTHYNRIRRYFKRTLWTVHWYREAFPGPNMRVRDARLRRSPQPLVFSLFSLDRSAELCYKFLSALEGAEMKSVNAVAVGSSSARWLEWRPLIKRLGVSDEVVRRFKDLIASGALTLGYRLPRERELTEALDASCPLCVRL